MNNNNRLSILATIRTLLSTLISGSPTSTDLTVETLNDRFVPRLITAEETFIALSGELSSVSDIVFDSEQSPVVYHGAMIYVSKDCPIVATDANGEVWAYQKAPLKIDSPDGTHWLAEEGFSIRLGQFAEGSTPNSATSLFDFSQGVGVQCRCVPQPLFVRFTLGGVTATVSAKYNWAAVDSNGILWAYVEKPVRRDACFDLPYANSVYENYAGIKNLGAADKTNWKDSLSSLAKIGTITHEGPTVEDVQPSEEKRAPARADVPASGQGVLKFFKGQMVLVGPTKKYIAADRNGEIWTYSQKPSISTSHLPMVWCAAVDDEDYERVGALSRPDFALWKDSLSLVDSLIKVEA